MAHNRQPAWDLFCTLLAHQGLLDKPFHHFQLDHCNVTSVIKYYSKLRQMPSSTVSYSALNVVFWEEYSWEYPPRYYVVFGLSLSISCRGISPHLRCHPSTCSIYHALISLTFTSFSLHLSFGNQRHKNLLCLPKLRFGLALNAKWELIAAITIWNRFQMVSVFQN